MNPGAKDGETVKWSNLEKEIEAHRGWMIDDGPKYDAIANRIATGHERLEAAKDPATRDAIQVRLRELELALENANHLCKRMFALRGFKYLKSMLGEGEFSVVVDDFRFGIE